MPISQHQHLLHRVFYDFTILCFRDSSLYIIATTQQVHVLVFSLPLSEMPLLLCSILLSLTFHLTYSSTEKLLPNQPLHHLAHPWVTSALPPKETNWHIGKSTSFGARQIAHALYQTWIIHLLFSWTNYMALRNSFTALSFNFLK